MEEILQMIFEFILDGSAEVAKNKKVSKWIRYPLIVILSVFVILVIGLIGFVGVNIILSQEPYSIIGGIAFLLIDFILVISIVKKISKGYKKIS